MKEFGKPIVKAVDIVANAMATIMQTKDQGNVTIYQDFYKDTNVIKLSFGDLGKADTVWLSFYFKEEDQDIKRCNVSVFDKRAKNEVEEFYINTSQALKILKHRSKYKDFYTIFKRMEEWI